MFTKFENAIKRCFMNIRKLIIGIIVSSIPIANPFLLMGYAMEASGIGRFKKKELPNWTNLPTMAMNGLIAIFIEFTYYIPAIASFLIAIALLSASILIPFASFFSLNPSENKDILMSLSIALETVPSSVMGMVFGFTFLGIIFFTIGNLISPIAILSFAKSGKLIDAFKIGKVFKRLRNLEYILSWVILKLFSFAVFIITSRIPLIGDGIHTFILLTISYTIYGEILRKGF